MSLRQLQMFQLWKNWTFSTPLCSPQRERRTVSNPTRGLVPDNQAGGKGPSQTTRLVERDPPISDESDSDSDRIHTVVNAVQNASQPVIVDVDVVADR